MKLFVPVRKYTNENGVIVTEYRVNPEFKGEIRILAISPETLDVSYKKIIGFTKHNNLKMYEVSSRYFDTFYVSEDHSLIAYDERLDCVRKVSPLEIIVEKERYYLLRYGYEDDIDISSDIVKKLRRNNVGLIPCSEISIRREPSINTAYDFTVEDYYTFSTKDGVFVQDTAGVYFIDTYEGRKEIFEKKMHTIFHIKYLQNERFIHTFPHEYLYALYILTSVEENDKKEPLRISSLDEIEIDYKYFNDIDRPVIIGEKRTTLGKVLLNKVAFDNEYLLDVTITKKNSQIINELVYRYMQKKHRGKSEYEINKAYLDKLHEITLFLASFISFSKYTPTVKDQDYIVYDDIVKKVDKLVNEPHLGKALYDKIVDETLKKMKEDDGDLYRIFISGSRASKDQVSQIVVARGYIADHVNRVHTEPIRTNLLQGLSEDELFRSSFGARKGLVDKKEQTPKTGYLARTMMMNSSFVHIDFDKHDCKTDRFLRVKVFSEEHARTLIGRYYLNPKTSKVELITEDNYIDLYEYCKQKKENIIYLRSPIYCKHSNLALCRKCAGDFEWKNIGLLSGAFIAERMTQLVLRVFHTSGAAVIDVPDEYREILDFSKVESPTKLKLTEDEIKLINGISKTQLNNVFHIDKDGRIVIDKVILNKDIVSAVEKIRGLLTKTIRVKGDPRYTPDVVYNVIMAEYLRHGFIKSIYVEVILSLMYIDEETNLPIRYVDEINWNKVTKLSLRQVGKYYSKLMRFIYEPNKNTLFDFVTGGNKVEVRDLYRRLIV